MSVPLEVCTDVYIHLICHSKSELTLREVLSSEKSDCATLT